jgi:hypothetical protein
VMERLRDQDRDEELANAVPHAERYDGAAT